MLTHGQIDNMSVIQLCRQSRNPEDPVISQTDCLPLIMFELQRINVPGLYEKDFPVAIVLIAAGLLVGPDVERLITLTGFPREFVERIAQNMFACGLWEQGHVHCEFLVDDLTWNSVGLMLNVFVAQGFISARQDAGRWRYVATEVTEALVRFRE
jgi:hypothetical protein